MINNNQKKNATNEQIVSELIRLPVYSLRNFLDTLCGIIVSYSFLAFIPIIKTFINDTNSSFGDLLYQVSIFVIILILLVDDHIRSRMLTFLAPCRSIGRLSLEIAVIICFGLSFFILSQTGSEHSYFSWIALIFAFGFRGLWARRTNNEAYIWENQVKDLKQYKESNKGIYRIKREFLPQIFEKNLWGIYRQRVKNTGWICFFYMILSASSLFIDGFDNICFDIMLSNYNCIENHTLLKKTFFLNKILPFLFSISFLYIESYRFKNDIMFIKKAGFNPKAENFSVALKTVFFMPSFYKEFLYKKAEQKNGGQNV